MNDKTHEELNNEITERLIQGLLIHLYTGASLTPTGADFVRDARAPGPVRDRVLAALERLSTPCEYGVTRMLPVQAEKLRAFLSTNESVAA